MGRNKKELMNELNKITDTVDIDFTNKLIDMSGEEYTKLKITKKTLTNIAKWALDGKSQFEIQQNLELNKKEWDYLTKVCPAILFVMQRSQAYADIVVAGTLYQTAIGGHTIHRKQPIKIKEYDCGRVVGEHIEIVEYDEPQPPNPELLKFLATHKLSETFGKEQVDNSKEHKKVIDVLTDEEIKTLEKLGDSNE